MKWLFSVILMVAAGTKFAVGAESLSDLEILNGTKQEMQHLDWKVERVSGKDKMYSLIFTDLHTGEQQVFHTRASIFQEANGSFSGTDYVWNSSDVGIYTFRHTNRGWTFLCGPTPARKEIRPPLPGPFILILKKIGGAHV